MSDYVNPFASGSAANAIWTMLVERDIEAFLACDWSAVEKDFVRDAFFGIDAQKMTSPDLWRLAFPDLESYRAAWLEQAEDMRAIAALSAARDGIRRATTLRRIDVAGDRAIAHKLFDGAVRRRDGAADRLLWRTIYVCQCVDRQWRIASFVGYLPHNGESP